jgi:molybdopterin biosynthesis enzyme
VLDEDAVDCTGPMAQALTEAVPGQGVHRKGDATADAGSIVRAWWPGRAVDAARRPRLRVVNVPGGTITATLIANSLRETGATVVFAEPATRDRAAVAELLDGRDCDLVIIVGGSGAGRTDAAVIALAGRGEVIAHGLALQPGRTAAVGLIGSTPVIAVPGAPDAALAVWWTLVLPALDRLTGRQRAAVTRPLARKIASQIGIAELVLLGEKEGAWMPLAIGDLPFATIAKARAWLLVPGFSEGYAAQTPVDAYVWRE